MNWKDAVMTVAFFASVCFIADRAMAHSEAEHAAEHAAEQQDPVACTTEPYVLLSNARSRFKQLCGTTRPDCDLLRGMWVCSSEQIGSGAPAGVGTVVEITSDSGTDDSNGDTGGDNDSSGGDGVVDNGGDTGGGSNPTLGLVIETETATLTVQWRQASEGSVDYIYWTGPQMFNAPGSNVLTYNIILPEAGVYRVGMVSGIGQGTNTTLHNDTWLSLPTGQDVAGKISLQQWNKIFTNNTSFNTVAQIDRGPGNRGPVYQYFEAGQHEVKLSPRSSYHEIDKITFELQGSGTPATPTPPADLGDPLIILHYDSAPDSDDLMAAVMAKAVVDTLQLDPYVVNGTYGYLKANQFIAGSTEHIRTLFPDAGDASGLGRGLEEVAEAQAIAAALGAGKVVYIAEGGPSDFTYAVVQRLVQAYPALDKKKIVVVQHSRWNEDNTNQASLNALKGTVTYRKIDDGNQPNATADFNEARSDADCVAANNSFLSSAYRNPWIYAWNTLPDHRKCDGSDTVELLDIVGDTQTRTLSDFVQEYN